MKKIAPAPSATPPAANAIVVRVDAASRAFFADARSPHCAGAGDAMHELLRALARVVEVALLRASIAVEDETESEPDRPRADERDPGHAPPAPKRRRFVSHRRRLGHVIGRARPNRRDAGRRLGRGRHLELDRHRFTGEDHAAALQWSAVVIGVDRERPRIDVERFVHRETQRDAGDRRLRPRRTGQRHPPEARLEVAYVLPRELTVLRIEERLLQRLAVVPERFSGRPTSCSSRATLTSVFGDG